MSIELESYPFNVYIEIRKKDGVLKIGKMIELGGYLLRLVVEGICHH